MVPVVLGSGLHVSLFPQLFCRAPFWGEKKVHTTCKVFKNTVWAPRWPASPRHRAGQAFPLANQFLNCPPSSLLSLIPGCGSLQNFQPKANSQSLLLYLPGPGCLFPAKKEVSASERRGQNTSWKAHRCGWPVSSHTASANWRDKKYMSGGA